MKTVKEFQEFFANNINSTIEQANKNLDCPGYGILMSNFSINTMDLRNDPFISDEFYILWSELEIEFNISMEVSDYDDLVIMTDKYSCED